MSAEHPPRGPEYSGGPQGLGVPRIAAGWFAFGVLLALVFTFSFRTNDDVEMMTYVSGMGGGTPDPQLAFTSSAIGSVLVGLYNLFPDVAWYGLYLHGFQLLGLTLLVAAVRLVAHRIGAVVAAAAIASVAAVGMNAIVGVQFTIVATLLGAGGVAMLLALAVAHRLRPTSAVLLGAVVGVAGLVRAQSLMLVIVMTVAVLVVLLPLRACPSSGLVLIGLAVAVTVAAGGAWVDGRIAAGGDDGGRWRQDLGLGATGLSSGADPIQYAQRRLPGVALSDNDLRLMSQWITPDEAFLQIDVRPEGSVVGPSGLGGDVFEVVRSAAGAPLLRGVTEVSLGRWWPMLALALLLGAALARGSRVAVGATLSAGAIVLAAVFVAGVAKYPERVGLGVLAILGVFPAVAASALARGTEVPRRTRRADADARPRRRSSVATWVLIPGLILGAEVPYVIERSDEAAWRVARAERGVAELEALRSMESVRPTLVLWLPDLWQVVGPLEWGGTAQFPDRAAEIAGWGYPTPFRSGQRAELGLEDWIGAVADRDDVWLVADAEDGDLIATYLRERRGRLCNEPILAPVTIADRWQVFKRFEEVPCSGQVVR